MIEKIDHVGIAVGSIEEAKKFFVSVLGMSVLEVEEVPDQKVKVAFLPIGGSEVELLESTDPEGPISRFIAKNGEGIQHIAFRVKDIKQALARLKEQGVWLIDQEPRRGAGGAQIAFIHPKSTGGTLIEICQRD